MLKLGLTFIVALFVVSGITGSVSAGVVCGLIGIAVIHGIRQAAHSQMPADERTVKYNDRNAPLPQDIQHDLQESSFDYSQATSQVLRSSELESRVASLEQQVSQLKLQLLQVLNAGVINSETTVKTVSPIISNELIKSSANLAANSRNAANVSVQTIPVAPLSKVYFEPNTQPAAVAITADSATTSASSATSGTAAAPASAKSYASAAPYIADKPKEPPKPSVIETLITSGVSSAKNWLMGGNTLVRVGIIILFFGVAFLLKFAADKDYVPIELRLLAVALLGIGLVGIGFRARNTAGKTGFSFAMQGGGVGVLYLTIFAAFKLYQLIPQGLTFGLLAGVAFASAGLAVLQSALPLSMLGFAGGFLAPILISTGGGSHIGLFSYYLVLNLGIAFVAYFRGWRVLNVMGFAFTFVIGTLWGVQKYTPDLFATTEPFLIAHGLIYTFIAVAYAFKRAPNAKDYVDATLVFGTPLVGFGLQYGLLKDSPMGMAYSALALGAYYMVLAWWIITRKRETLKFLGECFLALAIGFATLAIPLSLDGRWTSASWALEGVALLWVGLKQGRFLPSIAGLALQVLGAFMFINGWGLTGSVGAQGQNMFLGAAFIALSGLACGALLLRHSRTSPSLNGFAHGLSNSPDVTEVRNSESPTLSQRLYEKLSQFAHMLSIAAAVWGWAWLMLSGMKGISAWIGDSQPLLSFLNPFMLFVALSGVALYALARKLNWPMLRTMSFAVLPVMVGVAVWTGLESTDVYRAPSVFLGWLCWPVAVATYWVMLRWEKTAPATVCHGMSQSLGISNKWQWQSPLLWLVSGLGLLEINYWLELKTTLPMSIVYAAEGAALVWLGLRSVNWLPKAMVNPWVMVLAGLGLQVIAGLKYLKVFSFGISYHTYWQAAVIGSLIWFSAYSIRALSIRLNMVLSILGWVSWVAAGVYGVRHLQSLKLFEVGVHSPLHWLLAYIAVLSIAVYWLGRRLAWSALSMLSFAVLPLIGLGVWAEGLKHIPLSDHGWIGWPALLIVLPLLLHWQNKAMPTNAETSSMAAPWDFATGWLWRAPWLWALAWLAMRQAYGFTAQHTGGDWPVLAGLAASFMVVMVTLRLNSSNNSKINSEQRFNWVVMACGPVVASLLVYSIYATLNLAGDTPPLPYITVLNPLELGLLGIVMLAGLWLKAIKPITLSLKTNKTGFIDELLPHAPKLLAMLCFVWINSVLLRSLHHYAQVPYLWVSVMDNAVARAAFTLLWSLSALALMLYAHKKAARLLWMIGAALMVVVVAKLFLLDLSGRGTVERIVSFMGAGVLLLVMGYFAPLPPAKTSSSTSLGVEKKTTDQKEGA